MSKEDYTLMEAVKAILKELWEWLQIIIIISVPVFIICLVGNLVLAAIIILFTQTYHKLI